MPNSLGKTAGALLLAARHLKYRDSDSDSDGDGDDETTATAIATNTNVAFSPLSIHTSLALLAAGAIGLTLDKLVHFLDELTAADLSNFSRFVADKVLADRSASGGPQVLFGRGIWVDAACGPLKKAFEDVAASSYNAKAHTVDFKNKPEEAAEIINSWVKMATNDLLQSVINPGDINDNTAIVLADAVYFKGRWINAFNPSLTAPRAFHLFGGDQVDAPFMVSHDFHFVTVMQLFKILRLPYAHGQPRGLKRRRGRGDDAVLYSMCIFLPNKREHFLEMARAVTRNSWLLHKTLPQRMAYTMVQLPKFKISYTWRLNDDLVDLGLWLPFEAHSADLRGMFEVDDPSAREPFVSSFVHRAVVEVNEEGIDAPPAWSTRAGRVFPDRVVPIEFVADHAFMFFIMEELSGVVVFIGLVLNPTL